MLLLPAGRPRSQIQDDLFRRIRPALPIIGSEERAARGQVQQRASLRQAGTSPSYAYSQIAAIAVVNELPIFTRNVDDFADFQGPQIENWFHDPKGESRRQ